MTQAEVTNLLNNIEAGIEEGATIASVIYPPAAAALVVGKAVIKQLPALEQTVQNWIAGTPPTPEERADIAAKLAVLSDPNAP